MVEHYSKFYGQHADERILSEIRPYPLAMLAPMSKVILGGLVVIVGFNLFGGQLPAISAALSAIGWILGLMIAVGGSLAIYWGEQRSVGYITDRRIIRFQGVTPWTTTSRSLSWSEAVKVKTYASGLFWRMLNVGTVVVHAKSTILTSDEPKTKARVSDDDVELQDVHYFWDLGNYIDKIIYLYRQKPQELQTLRPFVAKPKGQRWVDEPPAPSEPPAQAEPAPPDSSSPVEEPPKKRVEGEIRFD